MAKIDYITSKKYKLNEKTLLFNRIQKFYSELLKTIDEPKDKMIRKLACALIEEGWKATDIAEKLLGISYKTYQKIMGGSHE